MFDIVQQGNRSTRFFFKIKSTLQKNKYGTKIFSYTCPGEWNKLSNSLKSCEAFKTFKHQLKKHFLDFLRTLLKN